MRSSVETAVKNRITEHGPGWCFTPMHFADLGSDVSIRRALSQLGTRGVDDPKIRQKIREIVNQLVQ